MFTTIIKSLPKQFQTDPTNEFLTIWRNCQNVKMLASLDVGNIFTNVPVLDTTNIIIQEVYDNHRMPLPYNTETTTQGLLEVCTLHYPKSVQKYQRCPIRLERKNPNGYFLGPTFANYNMGAVTE